MKYLLDTHVILWIAFNEDKISSLVKKLLLSNDNEIYISAVSFWEISIKHHSGKLDLKNYTPETLEIGFDQFFDYQPLDLEFKNAVSFFKLEKVHHKDPFDRMLIWQALQNDLIIVTEDENIKLYRDCGLKVVW